MTIFSQIRISCKKRLSKTASLDYKIISIISMWTFRIGLSYLLGRYFNMGVIGVWTAMIVDWVFRGTVFVIRFLSGRWRLQKGI